MIPNVLCLPVIQRIEIDDQPLIGLMLDPTMSFVIKVLIHNRTVAVQTFLGANADAGRQPARLYDDSHTKRQNFFKI